MNKRIFTAAALVLLAGLSLSSQSKPGTEAKPTEAPSAAQKRPSAPAVLPADLEVFTELLFVPNSRFWEGTTVVQRETNSEEVVDHLSSDRLEWTLDYLLSQATEPRPQREHLRALLTELKNRNLKSATLPQFGPKDRVVLMGKLDIDAVLRDGGYPRLRNKFTGFSGLVTLSLPAFSKDGKSALILYSRYMDGRAGFGCLDYLEKRDGKWTSVLSKVIWKS